MDTAVASRSVLKSTSLCDSVLEIKCHSPIRVMYVNSAFVVYCVLFERYIIDGYLSVFRS
jgi:hypothetical protein